MFSFKQLSSVILRQSDNFSSNVELKAWCLGKGKIKNHGMLDVSIASTIFSRRRKRREGGR